MLNSVSIFFCNFNVHKHTSSAVHHFIINYIISLSHYLNTTDFKTILMSNNLF